VPAISRLHELVEAFPKQVELLDYANSWNARFTLACAMQSMCDTMDNYFRATREDSSSALAGLFRRIAEERIVCDDSKLLAGTRTFFAVRLLQRHLQEEGEWEKVVPPLKPMSVSLPSGVSDEEIEIRRQQMYKSGNPGNVFLEYIKDRLTCRINSDSGEVFAALDNQLFEFGVSELNRLLDVKRKRASKG